MPATITHAYFAKDVYDLLDEKIKKLLNNEKKTLMMFSQGTDPLMFYHTLNIEKTKKIIKLQHTSHTEKTDLFFENLIQFIKEKKYDKDPKTLAFLYGIICHHTLDSKIHPLVYYKTGYFQKDKIETYKYNGIHAYMEIYIDNYMLQKKKQGKINFKNFCFDFTPFSKELKETIDYTFEHTFQIKNMGVIYNKSLKQMESLLTLFRLDHSGYKRKIYKLVDHFTSNKTFKLETLSYHLDPKRKKDYLNQKHTIWNYPVDKKIKSTKNFDQLYQDSLIEAKKIIEEINSFFKQNKKINIHQLFQNKSYLTGIDCDSKKEQKFFEF